MFHVEHTHTLRMEPAGAGAGGGRGGGNQRGRQADPDDSSDPRKWRAAAKPLHETAERGRRKAAGEWREGGSEGGGGGLPPPLPAGGGGGLPPPLVAGGGAKGDPDAGEERERMPPRTPPAPAPAGWYLFADTSIMMSYLIIT